MNTFLFIMALMYCVLNLVDKTEGTWLYNAFGWLGFAIALGATVFK